MLLYAWHMLQRTDTTLNLEDALPASTLVVFLI
jgi:hypothetical protein